ncbi:Phosphatidylserine decarboxylase proenzyme 2, mitochondrial [Schizosaccharomyces pombe]|uniref:Phosphatidylserine decarboxylase proenzyme 2, mitochondrial n=1 Tax=Schizosaccharomyces pombe (strain 972 / ATCC 24843) TaxID=284812 RepID=PSD2_SCHPO|nr:phosphatidylserine decarboxylase Psd2 [Schizosaccharomyces pombe]Q9UTB5.1 RecName: Full=Phosphatidylserine decarboxylase proenzyme 2, mitochondrial; Contains: RecName: Full=Phosphatidylserine decarboxylase 2 beta chain; Contains: RecName: Full=Phosphatidylserine decarboxylase 2 alpha chain; Flags: Precursor [Schizosaccharomyces pombe 972h-]CAB61769.1 phosphatidylserine decarboxylase Psd2 [Schizosaccharomyces pombe]|eukprot:NP_594463.1 phosphatidylserine decarboxylase Psd2 [Schizosaccharomyces pombe]
MRPRQRFRRFHPRWSKVNLRGFGGVGALKGVKALNGMNVRVSMRLKWISNRIHRIRRSRRLGRLSISVRPNGSWQVYLLSSLPLRSLSRVWGQFNRAHLPTFLRTPGFKLYAWVFGCNLSELKDPDLTHYRNFQDFFCRELRPETRPVDPVSPVVSPVDGRIVCQGVVDNNRIQHVKGLSYSLEALLGGISSSNPLVVNFEDEITPDLIQKHEQFAEQHSISLNSNNRYRKADASAAVVDEHSDEEALLCAFTDHPHFYLNDSRNSLNYFCPFSAFEDISNSVRSSCGKRLSPSSNFDLNNLGGDDDLRSESSSDFESAPASILEHEPTNWDDWVQEADVTDIDSLPWHNIRPGNKLFYSVIYLAPGDYHRFHSPADWVIESRRHFSGELFSVSPFLARRLHNLFVLNERVALLGRYEHGFMSMIPVGATNVGSIVINCDPTLSTNRLVLRKKSLGTFQEAVYKNASPVLDGMPVSRGEQVGGFQLGSTVVLVFEAPADFEFSTYQGQYVRVGEAL